jgi:hypothetical protein
MGYMTECSYSSISHACLVWFHWGGVDDTAMPAKAPAAMLAAREKLGGKDS